MKHDSGNLCNISSLENQEKDLDEFKQTLI